MGTERVGKMDGCLFRRAALQGRHIPLLRFLVSRKSDVCGVFFLAKCAKEISVVKRLTQRAQRWLSQAKRGRLGLWCSDLDEIRDLSANTEGGALLWVQSW